MFGDGEIVMAIRKQRLLLLSSSALKLLCCAEAAASQTLLKCHTLQANEFRGVDKNGSGFFHRPCSGAPVALIGQKGIRCDWPSAGQSNPELPPQLWAASPSSGCHWAAKAWEGGEG